jgi:hypothetical protein
MKLIFCVLFLILLQSCTQIQISQQDFENAKTVKIQPEKYQVSEAFVLFSRPSLSVSSASTTFSNPIVSESLRDLVENDLKQYKIGVLPKTGTVDYVIEMVIKNINTFESDAGYIAAIKCTLKIVDTKSKAPVYDKTFNEEIEVPFNKGKLSLDEMNFSLLRHSVDKLKLKIVSEVQIGLNRVATVLDRRDLPNGTPIYKISLGYLNNTREGDLVEMYPASGSSVSAKVSNKVFSNNSWVLLDKGQNGGQIKRGDRVFVSKVVKKGVS